MRAVDVAHYGEDAPHDPDALNFCKAGITVSFDVTEPEALSLTITSPLGGKRVLINRDDFLDELRRTGVLP